MAPKRKCRVICNSIIHLIMNEEEGNRGDDGDGAAERHFIQVSATAADERRRGGEGRVSECVCVCEPECEADTRVPPTHTCMQAVRHKTIESTRPAGHRFSTQISRQRERERERERERARSPGALCRRPVHVYSHKKRTNRFPRLSRGTHGTAISPRRFP